MGYFKIVIASLLICFATSCKKNAPEDIHIRGNVRNNCTGLGFSDRLVQLSFENQLFDRTTDANGDFDFGIVTVRPKDKTKFKLGVPGFSNQDFELYGLTVILDAEEIAQFNQFGISASFKMLHLLFPPAYKYNENDSIDLTFTQKTLRYYEPKRITSFSFKGSFRENAQGTVPGFTNYFSNIGGYPMGWWNFTLKKYKAGEHSVIYDSVFIDMGETKVYTIPF